MQHKFLGRKIVISKAGGNASKNATRGKLNIPKEILVDMEVTKEDTFVIIYDSENKEFTVRKETTEDMFL